MVIGFSLLILIPTIMIGLNSAQGYRSQIYVDQTQKALDVIIASADEVALEGYPSRRSIVVSFPASVSGIEVQDRLILMNVSAPDRELNILARAQYANMIWDAQISGKGRYRLVVSAIATGQVRITNDGP